MTSGRPAAGTVRHRLATRLDAEAIGALHADSWRRNYRGIYPDAFLDGEVFENRQSVWIELLGRDHPSRRTIVAEADGALVGFAHLVLDADPTWGSMLAHLHVQHEHHGRGIGTLLMAQAARLVLAEAAGGGLFLWVLEQNTAARAFYEARGGHRVERALATPPGGSDGPSAPRPARLRYVWSDPAKLLQRA